MTPFRLRGARCSAIFLLLCLAFTGRAPAQSRDADLVAIRQRVGVLESRLEEIRSRKRGLVGDLVEADYALQLQGERLAEARRELDSARLELEAAEQATAVVEDRLATVRSAASRRVAGLYRLGGRGAVKLALSVRATEDLLGVVRDLRYLVRRDVELRRELNAARAEKSRQLANLRLRRQEVEGLVVVEGERLADRRRLRRRRAGLLAELERREISVTSEFDGWVDREHKLSDLLTQLDAGDLSLAGRSIEDYRGVLDRPIVGSIVRAFGPRRDPRYQTLVPHNGLQFAGLEDEGVRVIFPGRVVYAKELEGYGQTVIVLHAGRVFSLYAGLDRIVVERDELLSIGQTVGAADGGLYFEIRQENRPIDPSEWIR